MLQVVGLLVLNQPSGCVLCGGSCGHAHEGVSSGHLSSPAGAGHFFKISCVISFRVSSLGCITREASNLE